jgi:hypothetical protein
MQIYMCYLQEGYIWIGRGILWNHLKSLIGLQDCETPVHAYISCTQKADGNK